MSELADIIKDLIRAEGPVPVSRYMTLALQHPEHGYYVKGDPLGKEGDFVTAPEVSQMFGEMLGVWLVSMWKLSGKPRSFTLLELGPGRGTLMADLLRSTSHVEGFHQSLRLYLLESNETLRAVQKERLSAYNPVHVPELGSLPDAPLFFVANEFFDAMPVHQYKFTPHGWREMLVGLEGDSFVLLEGKDPVPLPLPETSPFVEISAVSIAVMREIARRIARYGGAGLVADYGYETPPGNLSLQAVSRHCPEDPFARPGEVDVTAHVDFMALSLAAQKEGVFVTRAMPQGAFLQNMGIEIRADKLKKGASSEKAAQIDADMMRLTDPAQMGTLFKVMGLWSGDIKDVPGFT